MVVHGLTNLLGKNFYDKEINPSEKIFQVKLFALNNFFKKAALDIYIKDKEL